MMDIEQFTETCIINIINATQKASAATNREIKIARTNPNNNTALIEFDLAVSVEASGEAGGGIKIAKLQIGGKGEYKNSSISRVKFGVYVNPE